MRVTTKLKAAALAGLATVLPMGAIAQGLEFVGQPTDAGLHFQPAGGALAENQQWLDWMTLYIITAIVIFVSLLLLAVIVLFNSRANPVPRKFTHNTPLEIGWTLIPIVILIFIGAFSLPALVRQQTFPEGDVVIKVTGYQWYWEYEYPEEELGSYMSVMIGGNSWQKQQADGSTYNGSTRLTPEVEAALVEAGYKREHFLLATDAPMVVPVGAKVLLQITATDVIHSWTIPAFAVKQDAVPGRIAHAWFPTDREGIYFGQCSELCGKDHAYMPITVKVVSKEAYAAWVEHVKNGGNPGDLLPGLAPVGVPVQVASAN